MKVAEHSVGDFALLSDCHSAALLGRGGTVQWYCVPRFDSPSIFAHLLDPEGGHWSLHPVEPHQVERSYVADTMILQTTFRTSRGRVMLTDALALGRGARGHEVGKHSPHILVRKVEGIEGEVEMEMNFAPRPEYALAPPFLQRTTTGVVTSAGPFEVYLVTRCPLDMDRSSASARFNVATGAVVDFALCCRLLSETADPKVPSVDVEAELNDARQGWTSWAALHQGYKGLYVEQVRRSAMVLQALTYQPTGAVVAAATTSLPETQGGSDTWDYRYAWLRDLSLTLRALWVAACPNEVEHVFHWVAEAIGGRGDDGQSVQIVYSIEGERDLTERLLTHLRGFRGNRPVRVGNDAWRQKQLDVMGEVVDAAFLLRDHLGDFDDVTAHLVAALADHAASSWRETDAGMWEARDKERHYLSAKVMCWVALDRALQLAPRLGGYAHAQQWRTARADVREAILERGWSEKAGAYTGAFDSDELDASALLIPLVDFLPASDPRMRRTIEAIASELAPDGLVRRWVGEKNGFLLCTYWLVECLARAGETQRATALFEHTTSYANDLGLLAEEADEATGELWGNFPQAFSHVGLINAAWSISQAQNDWKENI